MTTTALLDKLSCVRRTGPGRWIAKCPAHEDRSPSLSIRELEDGRTLLHCFTGCAANEVVSALGMTLSDLFPPRTDGGYRPERRPFFGDDMLKVLARDALLISIAGETMARGEALSDDDRMALTEAAARLRSGIEACMGRAA